MPYLDSATDSVSADRIRGYWARRVKDLHATHIAGIRKRKVSKNLWYIEVVPYVPEDSAAFINFRNRMGF